jgi:aminoglycoside phosphotransferase (APT) family kinase protein
VSLEDPAVRAALERHLAAAFGAEKVAVRDPAKLSGGAIQVNWSIDLELRGGPRAGSWPLVLRTDAPSGVAVSHGRAAEFRLLEAAWAAGVTVPEPIHLCEDASVIGRPFALMRRLEGVALGPKVVKDQSLGGDREALVERLGEELARIHTIRPETHAFPFLDPPAENPGLAGVETFRRHLDDLEWPQPALEWGLRWLERHARPADEIVLAHHDFRTGNIMLTAEGLAGILDWEFAGWSEPHEDLGWFCAICWRFGARDKEAGGLGSRAAFYRGYRRVSGREIDPARVAFWEVFAHLRWAVIALQQGDRYLRGGEKTLDLALTGRRTPEIEFELLRMTRPGLAPPDLAREVRP